MKIAILGGGVAGVAAAIALTLQGHDVTVHERRNADTNIGAGIVVWPNAAFVLEQLGILDDVAMLRAKGMRVCVVTPEPADLTAMGVNLMNPTHRTKVLETAQVTAAAQVARQVSARFGWRSGAATAQASDSTA